MQGDYLAATCLLRSYEILNGKTDWCRCSWPWLIGSGDTRQQQHLLGAYSFASSGHIDLNMRGLSQSGTWNYLREEITMALELRRPVRMGTEFEFIPSKYMEDDIWANYISYILATIINFCFGDMGGLALEDRNMTWQEWNADVSAWRSNRPRSFDPFSAAPKAGNAFPSVWLLQPCHGNFSPIREIDIFLINGNMHSCWRTIFRYSRDLARTIQTSS
jgi:hypothetical protein